MVWFADVTIEAHPMIVSNFHGEGIERRFLLAGRALRVPISSNESMCAGLLQEARFRHLLQCRRCVRSTCAIPINPRRSAISSRPSRKRPTNAASGSMASPMQGRHPDQQCGDRRSRLHLHRGSWPIPVCTFSNSPVRRARLPGCLRFNDRRRHETHAQHVGNIRDCADAVP